jgi:hypothetical protein
VLDHLEQKTTAGWVETGIVEIEGKEGFVGF